MEDYISLNKDAWNKKTEVHLTSDFYDLAGFKKHKNSLKSIELDLLGEVKGKKILHLQCHFGQDSLSLANMGAKVTGADLSDAAIETARALNTELGLDAEFVCCDIYDLPQHLKGEFDIIFTSYGTIGWLPDIQKWANVVGHFLRKGGYFVMADFHPVVWMFDNDFQRVEYRYFNGDAIVEEISGSYTDKNAPITTKIVGWNHGLAEIINALFAQNLQLIAFQEFDYSPYPCFEPVTPADEEGKWYIKGMEKKIPVVYALKMEKR